MLENFCIVLSEKSEEEAAKDISLKVKAFFPKAIDTLIVLFTPHYNANNILKIIQFTLKPKILVGMQSPLLIFEDKIIEKGMAACCLNDEELTFKEMSIKDTGTEDVESTLRLTLKDLGGEKHFIFSYLPADFNFFTYLRGLELAAGKSFNNLSLGYMHKYAYRNYQILNNAIEEKGIGLIAKDLETVYVRLDGFLPVGKAFRITKIIPKKGVIMEINNQPAVNIYKHYAEDKLDVFKKNRLFFLYPFGIKEEGGKYRLINVVDILEDGSLFCMGDVKENIEAHIMLMHPPTLFETLESKLSLIKKSGQGLVIAINTMSRKKMLKSGAAEEIRLIKHSLGDKFKMIGAYCDYFLMPNIAMRNIEITSGSLLLSLWK